MPKNNWDEYKKLFLSDRTENQDFRKEVREMLTEMKTDIGALKVKAAIAGGMAGLVGTGIVTMILSAFK